MKKINSIIIIALFILTLSGCQSQETEKSTEKIMREPVEEIVDVQQSVTEQSVTEESVTAERLPGSLPWDFPTTVTLNAKAGAYVLAPSKSSFTEAFEDDGADSPIIFYNRVIKEVGTPESKVEEFNEEASIPNSLIIPIKPGQTANPGDIVLTWWQSGSGMTRAIIVDGGTPTEPMAKYLDLTFDYEPEKLLPDSFHVLLDDLEPGTSVAVKAGEDYEHKIIIKVIGEKALTTDLSNIISVYNVAELIAIPIKPEIEVGQEVYIPTVGTFRPGKIMSIDEINGKASVEYEWAGSQTEEEFSFGDISSGF